MSNYLTDVPVVWLSRSDDFVLYGTRNLNIDCLISTPDFPLLSVVWQKTSYGVTTQLNVAISALTVTIPSSTYSVLLGNQISITCTVSGSPSATNVYWMKQQTNGGSFSNVDISGNNRYSGGTLSSPTLVINSAQFSDEGNYRCHGVNAAGDANSIVTNLDVTGSEYNIMQHESCSLYI
ncbi:unnamed protein product [Mytilus edulis]|uniref:Ig-like domain-containing protein n=1 Tax=Mytilus edulis TaxID=6550 RepID=A0A8S3QG17_MYTED|nr:unnamed protein product [Mytilus edulis]